jgi:uncharacterized damage-inducible protein DinB
MNYVMRSLIAIFLGVVLVGDAFAQETGFKQEFLRQYNSSSQKLTGLAEAMPAESYDWRPMEGVASVADAYMHIAYYNYYYPETSLSAATPSDIDIDAFETIEDKEAVVEQLRRSLDHVIATVEAMPPEAFDEMTEHYGRSTSKRAVLMSLIVHMNEHLGQQIAYARSNHVVPPWSQ